MEMLSRYRSGDTGRESLLQWIEANKTGFSAQVSRGVFLRLLHGSDYAAATSIANVLAACALCGSVCQERTFLSWIDYLQGAGLIEAAEAVGRLTKILPPRWTMGADSGRDADVYYGCPDCGAVWGLILPEREEHGSWRRLA